MLSFTDILKIPLHELAQQKLRPVKVAVLDTGIDASHEALKGKVLRAFGFQRNEAGQSEAVPLPRTANNDPSGHGTGAAAIIGTLAPNAKFIDYRVLDADNGGYGSTVVKGLEEAIDSDADIINMSVAYRKDRYWEQTAQLLEKAYLANKIVVASKRNIPLPGDLGLPAELSNAISVDMGSFKDPYLIKYISYSKIEYMANGSSVLTANTGGGYIRMTGTSFATPTITAICSLYKGLNPKLTLFEIKSLLKCSNDRNIRDISSRHIVNPLEVAPSTTASLSQTMMFSCPICKTRVKISDAFKYVKCSACGSTISRQPLLDTRMYSGLLGLVRDDVPEIYCYHNWKHADEVASAVYKILGHYDCIPYIERKSLIIAALLHDYGYCDGPIGHEHRGADLAMAICRSGGINEKCIIRIGELIRATDPKFVPKSLGEKIIQDADLYHHGTDRQDARSQLLRKELANLGQTYADDAWERKEADFRRTHRFNLKWLNRTRNLM